MPPDDDLTEAFGDQEDYDEVVEIDEDGQVRPVGKTPPSKKKTVLRDPRGEYQEI